MIRSRHWGKGSTRAWRKRRAAQLQAEPNCRMCAARGRTTPATIADHIIPLADGGDLMAGELQSLCNHCDDIKSELENAAREGRKPRMPRKRMGCDPETGMPLDPDHPWNEG